MCGLTGWRIRGKFVGVQGGSWRLRGLFGRVVWTAFRGITLVKTILGYFDTHKHEHR